MEDDARDDHPPDLVRSAQGEEGIAGNPGHHADGEHPFHPEPDKEKRHDQHEEDLRHLPVAHGLPDGQAGHFHDAAGDLVVERERDADEHRGEDEDQVGGVLQEDQGVEAENLAGADRSARGRRRVGEQEAEEAQQDRSADGHVEHVDRRVELEPREGEARDDPADGPEDADERELLLRIGHRLHRDGVGQRQSGVEAQHVAEDGDPVDRGRARIRALHQHGAVEHERGADEVHHSQDALRGEEPVGDHADEERRDDSGDGADGVGRAEVRAGESDGAEVIRRGDIPGAPDEELEQHHDGELDSGEGAHGISPTSPSGRKGFKRGESELRVKPRRIPRRLRRDSGRARGGDPRPARAWRCAPTCRRPGTAAGRPPWRWP